MQSVCGNNVTDRALRVLGCMSDKWVDGKFAPLRTLRWAGA